MTIHELALEQAEKLARDCSNDCGSWCRPWTDETGQRHEYPCDCLRGSEVLAIAAALEKAFDAGLCVEGCVESEDSWLNKFAPAPIADGESVG